MLTINKETVDFLVTSTMIQEVQTFLQEKVPTIEKIANDLSRNGIQKFFFVGCGSSKAVGTAAKYLFDRYSNTRADVYTGWEFCDNPPHYLDASTAVVVISHSGTTEEIVRALRLANEKGATTVSIVNQLDNNPLGVEATCAIDYNAHAMWECHLLSVYYLALNFILNGGESQEARRILADIPRLPGVLGQLIQSYEAKALEMVRSVGSWKGFYTVAAGPLLSLAYKEGIITNMEFVWGHGSVIESGEFRHGPLEITEDGVPFLFLLGTDPSRHTTERALSFVKRYSKSLLVLDYQEISAGLHSDLAPMMMFVPLEWLSYYLALMNNHNPDDRRYYNIVNY